jgi:peptide/nickel transport system substrate-binding protein
MTEQHGGERETRFTRRQVTRAALAGGAALALGGSLAACGGGSSAPATTSVGPPRKGGRLRVGVTGAGSTETLNPTQVITDVDTARSFQVFENLTAYDSKGKIVNLLAEQIEPSKRNTVWTIRVLDGVEFHDGKTLTADDVIYTLAYNADSKNGSYGSGQLAEIKRDGLRKIDARTLRVELTRPNAFFPMNLADNYLPVIQDGTKSFDHPIGTGPFEFVSWKVGERARYRRFGRYHVADEPLLDELEIVSITDDQAKVDILSAGQVDLVSSIDLTSVDQVKQNPKLRLLESESAYWVAMYMVTSGGGAGPFADERVRQAMRMLIDREQVIQNGYYGHARIGNDMFAWFDDSYPSDAEQTSFDPEQARSLLSAAGRDGLSVELYTAAIAPGALSAATLLAESAKEAGVDVAIKKMQTDRYFASEYMNQPFGSTYWAGRGYASQASACLGPNAPLDETRWRDAEWQRLFDQARASEDPAEAVDLQRESQLILHERGGYIIPAFPNFVDASTDKVGGIEKSLVEPLGRSNFRRAYIAA